LLEVNPVKALFFPESAATFNLSIESSGSDYMCLSPLASEGRCYSRESNV